MFLPSLSKGPNKTNRSRSTRHRAKIAAKNNRRRQHLKK